MDRLSTSGFNAVMTCSATFACLPQMTTGRGIFDLVDAKRMYWFWRLRTIVLDVEDSVRRAMSPIVRWL